MSENSICLTQYSHGAGCDYKISPKVLETILRSEQAKFVGPNLFVDNKTRDDAAVYDLGNGTSVINTTNFLMLTVDNPFDLGRIVTTNIISDIFAMEGRPVMAIAIPGWLISKLSPGITREVTEGGRYVCRQADIVLAGGHSVDAPEPIFGLAVTGIVPTEWVEKNSIARAGCKLFLTKPLGIGALTTTEKESLLKPEHQGLATEMMCRVNIIGTPFANIEGIKAMTDVMGSSLLGHLSEMCQGAGVQARVDYEAIPKLPGTEEYIELGATPDGIERNFTSYGYLMGEMPRRVCDLLYGPQASGGLLLAAMLEAENEIEAIAAESGIELMATGGLVPVRSGRAMVETR